MFNKNFLNDGTTYGSSINDGTFGVVGKYYNGSFEELRFNFSKVPIHLIQQFCKELRKNMFQYMIENNDEVLWDEKYLIKILENILAITKLNIDDFS